MRPRMSRALPVRAPERPLGTTLGSHSRAEQALKACSAQRGFSPASRHKLPKRDLGTPFPTLALLVVLFAADWRGGLVVAGLLSVRRGRDGARPGTVTRGSDRWERERSDTC